MCSSYMFCLSSPAAGGPARSWRGCGSKKYETLKTTLLLSDIGKN
jgi:hypothetical protein